MYSSLLNSGSLSFDGDQLTIDQGIDANDVAWQGTFTSTGGAIAFDNGSTFTNNGVLTLGNTALSTDGTSTFNNGGIVVAGDSPITLAGSTSCMFAGIMMVPNPQHLFGYWSLFEGSIYLTAASTLTNSGALSGANIIAADQTQRFQ